jgi:DNA-binding beta-propeller fold protein YncE
MRGLLWVGGLLAGLALAAPGQVHADWTLVGCGSNSLLYDVDPLTGAVSNERNVGTNPLLGISMSPGGQLYGLAFNENLYSIDPIGATSVLVGYLGFQIGEGDAAFDPTTGVLYGMAHTIDGVRHLFTVDTETGLGTDVAPVNQTDLDPSAMAFDAAGTLYILDTFNDELLTVDETNGDVLTSVALSRSLGSIAGMDFHPDSGVLHVADGGGAGTDSLYTLDVLTGQLTLMGSTGLSQGLAGLEFIPEPATLLLYVFGASVFLGRRRRLPVYADAG